MTAPVDRYGSWDAAYVLGALSPSERREFEEHLAGCPGCQAAVSELAGLPGLLAQVSPEDAALLAATPDRLDDGPPPGLLSKMISGERARRRRLVGIVVGAAAALVLLLGGIGYAAGLLPVDAQEPQRIAFYAVAPTGMTGNARLVPVTDGTEIEVECVYAKDNAPTPGSAYAEYVILVMDKNGQLTEVKRWPAKPNKQMTPSGHTDLELSRIESVEIRDGSTNQTVLRAHLR